MDKWIIIAVMVCLIICSGIAATIAAVAVKYNKKKSCKGVTLWSKQGLNQGDQYCAKPGVGPTDLPFTPQAFQIAAGSTAGFTFQGTTKNTGSIDLSLKGDGEREAFIIAPDTITKVNKFQVT